ncbi:ABC transporter substrate-binding protein [Herbaspirillum seropedicae]|uniref:ABC-type branched-chain amino acid transport system, periplasmic component protein n=1 Tax=Herbaspirillum seropedicae (strain SmR1) TaxID=757424 RepID=D8IQB9_HERSS|nr:ABC transporter substrate-binding protein [Herbaspirillum seropedicae]ADJ65031.1 ABC-type branched-chain amino acid transport system, periplasmic component protein [Herbaspirillum seropedicae SmR1]AKN66907.1 branched-chain amino acid ABC transporter substrate-binding protein [Herbaspirillum seropedicae]NQE28082.1 branched-chain amino acid ABC transporter substrate-binding protein [Herbaspirillum seropedicae]
MGWNWCHRLRGCLGLAMSLLAVGAAAEDGVSATEVVLGQSAPFSGPASDLGRDFLVGAQSYFAMVNAKGGVHGRRVRLLSLDDGYEPERTAANTQQLIWRDKVFALFGYSGTATTLAALPAIREANVPLFAPVSGALALREPFNRLIFHVRASYAQETDFLLRQLQGTGRRKVAVFYQNDELGKSMLEQLRLRALVYGLTLVGTAAVERNSDAVEGAAQALLKVKPDVVIQVVSYRPAAALIARMRQAGYLGGFSHYSFVGSLSLSARLKECGIGAEIAQVVPFPNKARLPLVYEYRKAVAQHPGAVDNFLSLEGYIAARTLVEGLRRAGRALTREGLIRALETISPANYDGGGFSQHFSRTDHSGSDFVDLTAIGSGGRFIN